MLVQLLNPNAQDKCPLSVSKQTLTKLAVGCLLQLVMQSTLSALAVR
jgi:hypothetical protein